MRALDSLTSIREMTQVLLIIWIKCTKLCVLLCIIIYALGIVSKDKICVKQAPYLEIKKQMDRIDPLAHPLLQW